MSKICISYVLLYVEKVFFSNLEICGHANLRAVETDETGSLVSRHEVKGAPSGKRVAKKILAKSGDAAFQYEILKAKKTTFSRFFPGTPGLEGEAF